MAMQNGVTQGRHGRCLVVYKAGTGEIKVEQALGPHWVLADTLKGDTSVWLDCGDVITRFTPTGGALYEVHDQ